jgi:hypothetical protein
MTISREPASRTASVSRTGPTRRTQPGADGDAQDDAYMKIFDPQGQCGHLTLGAWNHVSADIGAVASAKSIVGIDIGYDQPGSSGGYRGYIDDIALSRP